MDIKKDDRVVPSGYGRTRTWDMMTGTVIRRRGRNISVHWDGTHFEDEMDLDEVAILV